MIRPFLMGLLQQGGKGGPELPLQLGVNYWWDARETDLVSLNGADVASWTCRITGSVFSQAAPNQPAWNATDADFSGSPSVQFDKTNSERLVWVDGTELAFLSDGTGGTAVIVHKNLATGVLFSNGGTTSPSLDGMVFPNIGTTTQGCIISNNTGIYVANFNAAFTAVPEVAVFRFEIGASPEVDIAFQGSSGSAAAVGTPVATTNFSSAMGKQGNSAQYASDKICQVLLWRRRLSDGERSAVIAWAQSTFGVA